MKLRIRIAVWRLRCTVASSGCNGAALRDTRAVFAAVIAVTI